MNLDAALKTYVAESRDLLQEAEEGLLRLEQEQDQGRDEALQAIFRAAHTIKGSAGLFGLGEIETFTHGVETLLDQLREGSVAVDSQTVALLLESIDHIAQLVEKVAAGEQSDSGSLQGKGADLLERLADRSEGSALDRQGGTLQRGADSVDRPGDGARSENDDWHISLRFGREVLRDGMDPLAFLRYLTTLGQILSVTPLDDAIPPPGEMDPELCYLGFEIRLHSDADKQTIENVFEFVRGESTVRILPPRSRIADYIEHIEPLPEEDLRIGEILVRCGSLTPAELQAALQLQEQMRAQAVQRQIGDIVVDSGMSAQPVVEAAVEKQKQVRQGKAQQSQSMRVDAEKLDQLVNLIGELVIAGAGSALSAQMSGDAALSESMSSLTRLIEEVRDCALRLRMVQIGATFSRFQRVVREVSKELGKEINLVITGAETELDKSVVEKIGDPLVHLVRNAIDHGIEPAELRATKGKPAAGTVRLNAYHDSGSIVIEVSDDGAGLDREQLERKALEQGLVHDGQQLEDQEVYNLIFEPGFSTAGQVTNLSGRGVGMDVVKRNISALRGMIELDTRPGRGTTVRVRLPLTLAIIDGFLVGVGDACFVVPLEMVLECVELTPTVLESSAERDYLNLRGEVLPFIRLRDVFDIRGRPPCRANVVIVQYGGSKAGLVVDRLMGEFQTVIKPLGRLFSHVGAVSGSTILGNGNVALILNVPTLVQRVSLTESRAVGTLA